MQSTQRKDGEGNSCATEELDDAPPIQPTANLNKSKEINVMADLLERHERIVNNVKNKKNK
ncbi:MAG: hypothetical protein ACI4MS_03665 [Candidatus Coproplasma sp.]